MSNAGVFPDISRDQKHYFPSISLLRPIITISILYLFSFTAQHLNCWKMNSCKGRNSLVSFWLFYIEKSKFRKKIMLCHRSWQSLHSSLLSAIYLTNVAIANIWLGLYRVVHAQATLPIGVTSIDYWIESVPQYIRLCFIKHLD